MKRRNIAGVCSGGMESPLALRLIGQDISGRKSAHFGPYILELVEYCIGIIVRGCGITVVAIKSVKTCK